MARQILRSPSHLRCSLETFTHFEVWLENWIWYNSARPVEDGDVVKNEEDKHWCKSLQRRFGLFLRHNYPWHSVRITSAVLLFLWANKLGMSGEHVTNMTNEMHESAQIQMKRRRRQRLDKQCPREEMREREREMPSAKESCTSIVWVYLWVSTV